MSEREHNMGITNMTVKFAVTALAAATVLLLSSCSAETGSNGGSDGEPQRGVFEFQANVYGSDGELTVRIPAALVKAAGNDAEGLLVGQITAQARELDSSKYCAVDLAIDYRGDGLDELAKPSMSQKEYDESHESALKGVLNYNFGVSTMEEAKAQNPPEQVDEIVDNYFYGSSYKATPAWGQLNVAPEADLDVSDPQPGEYISDDSKVLTFVQQCATSPNDDETADAFSFPVQTDGEINVMKNGTLGITEAVVSDYQRDSNGDWIGG
ncbi:hypothetical protein [Cryobacterium sp. Y57]|uniref:hypothetical protein n=1 Tax=Cryobacterium sp. Y57 TaxID=2048287 RepID=UPI001304CA42|nr:hypothetical protein [Cryobacterium sp. Y57]